jgi:hypothetical protein
LTVDLRGEVDMAETLLSPSNILLYGRVVDDLRIQDSAQGGPTHSPFIVPRTGGDRELEHQLTAENAAIARIYSFSFEGTYYDLPRPALFLVHGPGLLVTNDSPKDGGGAGDPGRSIAPGEPSLTGVAAADFQFADGIRVWSYDKADHTIRMDVEAGEFESVLLSPFFGDGGLAVSGAMVSGRRVNKTRIPGSRVSGAMLSGAMLRGGGSGD